MGAGATIVSPTGMVAFRELLFETMWCTREPMAERQDMRKHTIAIVSALCIGTLVAAIGGFFGAMWYIERLRDKDAAPAFRPLVPLGVSVLSNPVAFHRYCIYYAEFPSGASLCDTNICKLVSLNELPEQNELNLVIRTPRVTDASLPHLKAIRKIDFLDVTESSISDAGIEELRKAFPNSTVVERRPKPANKPQPQSESRLGGADREKMVDCPASTNL